VNLRHINNSKTGFMLSDKEKIRIHQNKPSENIRVWLLLFLVSMFQAAQSQTVTKTIIINQVTYGTSNADLIKGNGITATEKRQVSPFQAIKVEGAMNVNYSRAANVQVEVSGDQNLLPLISTQVVQGVLIISSKQSYQTQRPIAIELTSPSISAVTAQGAGDVNLKALSEKSLILDLKGSGNVNAEGNVGQFSAYTRGSGDVNAKGLETIDAELQITGSGNITNTVNESLKAKIIGSGDITYFGHPKNVAPRIVGSGRIVVGD
jgi:Putative auto-transporter adhesin, head GIN domain